MWLDETQSVVPVLPCHPDVASRVAVLSAVGRRLSGPAPSGSLGVQTGGALPCRHCARQAATCHASLVLPGRACPEGCGGHPAERNLYRRTAGRWPAADVKESFAMSSWTLFLQMARGCFSSASPSTCRFRRHGSALPALCRPLGAGQARQAGGGDLVAGRDPCPSGAASSCRGLGSPVLSGCAWGPLP